MKKLLFKVYGINLIIGVLLYFGYRYYIIIKPDRNTDGWFDTIINIIDIFLNIHFALIFIAIIVLSSLTFSLNLNAKIRNNYLLSLLTFIGIPLFCTVCLIVGLFNDYNYNNTNESPLTTITMFSIIYLLILTIEFFLFRKKMKSINEKSSI